MLTDTWGIDTRWIDAHDQHRTVAEPTLAALHDVIGAPPPDLDDTAPVVVRPGAALPGVALPAEVECEDGSTRTVEGPLPTDFPLGYHWLTGDGIAARRRLIVSPGRCVPPPGRSWGVTVQLYAARSRSGWGIGDLADLRTLRRWVEARGGGFLLVNPLFAVAPTPEQEPSPYLPVTRRWRNPLYLRVEEVPGAADVLTDADHAEVERLRSSELVDRDAVWRLKRSVLERAFAARDSSGDTDGFADWRAAQGEPLQQWATWCALADAHGPDWREWPEPLRHPDRPEVAERVAANESVVGFHAWLQWALDVQLAEASGDLTVVQDLPIGVAGGGADAWAWQDVVATGVEVGAPPDVFNPAGQSWGSPPYVPWRLRAAGYAPFVQAVRGAIAGAGGLRIDHVMGLFRLWWVPPGATAPDGAYVRYPGDDLLDIVALESHRAGALVVGEDLGTVEPGVRETLAERGLLAYQLLWFEDREPAAWSPGAMAAVTTHDLPTITGLVSGSDLDEQLGLDVGDPGALADGRDQLLQRVARAGVRPGDPAEEAVPAVHRRLAEAPAALVAATLEDLVGQDRRPNMPGTSARLNWSLPLPVPVDDLPDHLLAGRVLDALHAAVHGPAEPVAEPVAQPVAQPAAEPEGYDVARVRAAFPALVDGVAYFDGPGGSQVPGRVADAVAATLRVGISNRGTTSAAELRADEIVLAARRAMADLLGSDPRGVVFGRSMTQLTYDLARTVSAGWSEGDEVLVSRLDHDANIRPWVHAAGRVGATVRWADFDPGTGELPVEAVADQLGERTRVVAVTGASNLLGTRPDVPAIAAAAHAVGAVVFVDGVHLTPHAPVDVTALGADVYACSPYKFFGPHLGVLSADPAWLERLDPPKLLPQTDAVPERFELGTLPYELLVGVTVAVDFLADLAPGAGAVGGDRRSRVLASMAALETYEDALFQDLLAALGAIDGVTLHGGAVRRTPTALFSVRGRTPDEVHTALSARGVNAPGGNFYALEASRWIGLGAEGANRAGLAPYTNRRDVERLAAAVAELATS